MSDFRLSLVVVLMIGALALAQPAVDAPLMPMQSFAPGMSPAVVSSVVVGQYVFTADANVVWGLNIDEATNEQTLFKDSLSGVTQMWGWCANWYKVSTCRLHVIAGPSVVMYCMNTSTVWRAAMYSASNGTFDIVSMPNPSYSLLPSPSYMYPVVVPYEDGNGAFLCSGRKPLVWLLPERSSRRRCSLSMCKI
jgi:hypothetical protein